MVDVSSYHLEIHCKSASQNLPKWEHAARMEFKLFTVSGDDLETFVIRHIIAALQQPVSHTNQAFITTK